MGQLTLVLFCVIYDLQLQANDYTCDLKSGFQNSSGALRKFYFKGLISHFLPSNENKMVTCALRECNKVDRYPRFCLGRTVKELIICITYWLE